MLNKKVKAVLFVLMCMGVGNVQAITNQELERELQALKNKVQELEKYTVPPEKADIIKKVTEYVCPNGHTYSSPPNNMICPDDGLKIKEREALIKVKLNRREEVGEKISGMLEEEFKKRVNIAVSGTGIIQHVADSLEPETKKQTYAQGSMNLYLLSRPMRNGLFFVDIEAQGGQVPDSFIANNSVLNNDSTSLPSVEQADQVRFREAWLQTSAFRQQLQLVIGKIDLTNYFDRNRAANDETSQFITGTLVNNPVLSNPPNGPGAALSFDTRKGVAVGIGVQSPDATGFNITEQPYFIGEVDIRSRLWFGRLGNYRFWVGRNGRTSGEQHDDYSAGISADQELGSKLIAFGRIGRAVKKDPVRDPHAWSAGLLMHNFIPERRRDRIGVGYSHYLTSNAGGLSGETESIGETYYSVYVTEHLSLTPLVQYVFHTAGTSTGAAQSNVLIFGFRTQIYF